MLVGGAVPVVGWVRSVVVLCLRLPLLFGFLVVAALRKSKTAKCGLERRRFALAKGNEVHM